MARSTIGFKIRDRRKALGVTQANLSARLGISASYLNLIESNKRNIGGGLLKKIADELGVTVDLFDGAAERRLVNDLTELSGASILSRVPLDPADAGDFASQHPQWAQALVMLHRAYHDRNEAVTALSDRLNQDPFLGDAIHIMLTNVAAIRSSSEILENIQDLEPQQRQRFLSIIASESNRLSDVAQALAAFFDRAHSSTRSVTPVEEVDDFIQEHENYFPELEAGRRPDPHRHRHRSGPGRKRTDRLPASGAMRCACDDRAVLEPERRRRPRYVRFDFERRHADGAGYRAAATRRFELAKMAAQLDCPELIAAAIGASPLLLDPGRRAAAPSGPCSPTSPAPSCCLTTCSVRARCGALRHRLPVPPLRRQLRAGLPSSGYPAQTRAGGRALRLHAFRPGRLRHQAFPAALHVAAALRQRLPAVGGLSCIPDAGNDGAPTGRISRPATVTSSWPARWKNNCRLSPRPNT